MQGKLKKVVQGWNRGRVALALDLMGSEAYLVQGVRSGAYDGSEVYVESEAWAIASMLLPRKMQGQG